MAFNKFDPHKEDDAVHGRPEARTPSAERRARLLRWGWWVSVVYTAIGFLFLGVFWLWGNPF